MTNTDFTYEEIQLLIKAITALEKERSQKFLVEALATFVTTRSKEEAEKKGDAIIHQLENPTEEHQALLNQCIILKAKLLQLPQSKLEKSFNA